MASLTYGNDTHTDGASYPARAVKEPRSATTGAFAYFKKFAAGDFAGYIGNVRIMFTASSPPGLNPLRPPPDLSYLDVVPCQQVPDLRLRRYLHS
jgi:hypothetical protein